jgi:hypothetical protein
MPWSIIRGADPARRPIHAVWVMLLSLLFFPLSLIMAYVVHDRRADVAYR